jgi:hypothetical protein
MGSSSTRRNLKIFIQHCCILRQNSTPGHSVLRSTGEFLHSLVSLRLYSRFRATIQLASYSSYKRARSWDISRIDDIDAHSSRWLDNRLTTHHHQRSFVYVMRPSHFAPGNRSKMRQKHSILRQVNRSFQKVRAIEIRSQLRYQASPF